MNENINLCEILKGHEGETFYSPIYGDVTFNFFGNHIEVHSKDNSEYVKIASNGYNSKGGEMLLFPSKNQRDWNKWVEEQKSKVPKTWREYVLMFGIRTEPTLCSDSGVIWNAIGDSCSALFKIHQLIKIGYGGNVTNDEWNNTDTTKITVYYSNDFKQFFTECTRIIYPIAFHDIKQAEEFLSYPENVQLLKDYFML